MAHKLTPFQARGLDCANENPKEVGDSYYSDADEAPLDAGQTYEDEDDYDAGQGLDEEEDDYEPVKKAASRATVSIFSKAVAEAESKPAEPIQMSVNEVFQALISQMKLSMASAQRFQPKNVIRVTLSSAMSLTEFAAAAQATAKEGFNGGVVLKSNGKFHHNLYKDRRVRRVGFLDYTNKHGVKFGVSMPQLTNGAVDGTHFTDTGRYLAVMAANTQASRFADPVIAFEFSGNNLRSVLLEKFPNLKLEEVTAGCIAVSATEMLVGEKSPVMEGVWERVSKMKEASVAKSETYTAGEPTYVAQLKAYTVPSAVYNSGVDFVKEVLQNSSTFDIEKQLFVVLNRAQSSNVETGKTNLALREKWLDPVEMRSSIKDGQALSVEFEKARVVDLTMFVEFE